MFKLPESVSELPDINDGVQRSRYEQVSATRDITGANWANGAQSFKFEVSGTKHWVPSKSYVRMRVQYVEKDALGNEISPTNAQYTAAPFVMGNLYQSLEFRIGDQTVGKIGQYVGQIDALKQRITQGGYYLNSVGNVMNATSVFASERHSIIAGADNATPASYTEYMWKPPLNIFDQSMLPAGKFELIMNPEPQSQWRLNAVLTKDSKTAGDNFDVRVIDCFLYVHTIEGSENVSNVTYALDLENYSCMADKVQTADTNQRFFDVSPSTTTLAVAYQDLRTNYSNMSSSLFRSSPILLAQFGTGKEERKLANFYIDYAGMQKPQPNGNFTANENSKYNLVQRYIENHLDSGLLHSENAPESYEEWLERGAFYLYSFPKSGEDSSTRVQVSQSFQNNADVTNMRILLFSISRTTAEITVTNGTVSNITLKER